MSDIRVLLVEDGPEDADFARSVLADSRAPRFTVHEVGSRSAATAYLADHTIDVILLDLGLPDGRGLEVLTTVREAAEYPAIVVLTGPVDRTLEEACLDAGAQDYLSKDDIDGHSLTRAVSDAVRRLQG